MAWTTPTTVNPGDAILSSLWNEQVRDNMLIGNPIFADEAARDAAIPSPVEGQRCYLTAPTIPAATGGDTFIPSGIQTIYNGSVWVCVTPVGAYQTATGTSTSTSYTTSLTGTPGTNVSATIVTGTTVLITLSSSISNNNAATFSYLSFSVSGASTIAADDQSGLFQQGTQNDTGCTTRIIGGLTPGTNTFTLEYRVNGNTGQWSRRFMNVQGIA